MNRIPVHPARALAIAVSALLAVLALAACGSSSSKTATTGASHTSTSPQSTTESRAKGFASSRFTALRECLKKQGINLPQRVPGGKRPRSGTAGPLGLGAAGTHLPSGVSRAQYEAALKKCGGFPRGRFTGLASSPAFKRSLEKFGECMRKNGISVPKANTSGKGPIFSTKGLDTSSSKFKAAESKCVGLLRVARPGATGGAPPPSG